MNLHVYSSLTIQYRRSSYNYSTGTIRYQYIYRCFCYDHRPLPQARAIHNTAIILVCMTQVTIQCTYMCQLHRHEPYQHYTWKLYPNGGYEPYTLGSRVPVDLFDLLNCCTTVHVPMALDLDLLHMCRQYWTAIPELLNQVGFDYMYRLCLQHGCGKVKRGVRVAPKLRCSIGQILIVPFQQDDYSLVARISSGWSLTVTTTCSGTINLFINIILLSRRSPRSLGDIRYESVPTLTAISSTSCAAQSLRTMVALSMLFLISDLPTISVEDLPRGQQRLESALIRIRLMTIKIWNGTAELIRY